LKIGIYLVIGACNLVLSSPYVRLTTLYKTCYSQGMAKVSEEIAKFSKNLVSSAADLVLFKIYLGVPWKLVGESDGEGTWEGLEGSFEALPALTVKKLQRALRFLFKQGYVELSPLEAHLVPQITEEGGKHLDSLFPVYNKERSWDKQFYLINYDIPVGKNSVRDALRLFLKGLGCTLLQSSVWMTPYNPTERLSVFVEKRNLSDCVVVSVLLDEFGSPELSEIYGFKEINQRYQEFVESVSDLKDVKDDERMTLAFEYFAILCDDPQLPFELLPEDWAGAKAQELFEKLFFGKA